MNINILKVYIAFITFLPLQVNSIILAKDIILTEHESNLIRETPTDINQDLIFKNETITPDDTHLTPIYEFGKLRIIFLGVSHTHSILSAKEPIFSEIDNIFIKIRPEKLILEISKDEMKLFKDNPNNPVMTSNGQYVPAYKASEIIYALHTAPKNIQAIPAEIAPEQVADELKKINENYSRNHYIAFLFNIAASDMQIDISDENFPHIRQNVLSSYEIGPLAYEAKNTERYELYQSFVNIPFEEVYKISSEMDWDTFFKDFNKIRDINLAKIIKSSKIQYQNYNK